MASVLGGVSSRACGISWDFQDQELWMARNYFVKVGKGRFYLYVLPFDSFPYPEYNNSGPL